MGVGPISNMLTRVMPALLTAAAIAVAIGLAVWLLRRWLHRVAPARPGTLHAAHAAVRVIEIAGVIAVALVAFRSAGIGEPRITWTEVIGWVMGPGLRILFIFAGAIVLDRVLTFFIGHLETVLATADDRAVDRAERRKRVDTLGRLLRAVCGVIIFGTAVLMALDEIHIDITPVLAGAGVLGVSLGIGAQWVVRDVIAGAFLILENQIRVGDVVTINGKTGLVESIRLRIVVLRALDGTVHIFQNGAVSEISNLTKDYSYAMLTVLVALKEDVGRVSGVLGEIGRELQSDAEFRGHILAPMEILGVESLAGTGVGIKVRIKTLPMAQFAVDRELRGRVKARFQQEQIALA